MTDVVNLRGELSTHEYTYDVITLNGGGWTGLFTYIHIDTCGKKGVKAKPKRLLR